MAGDLRIRPLSGKEAAYYGLVGLAALLFQTTIQSWIDPWGYGPDLCLVLVVHLGLTSPVTPGAALAVLLGFIKDASGAAVFGLYAGIFLLVFFLAALARLRLDPRAPRYLILFVLLLMLTSSLVMWLTLEFLGRPMGLLHSSLTGPTAASLISALVTALVSPFIFGFLDLFRRPPDAGQEDEEA